MQPLVLVLVIYLAGLFEHPAISVSVIGWFIGGAMNLERAIEYAVQTGRSQIVSFERLLPLTGFGVAETGIDYRILSVVAIVSALVSVAPWLSITVTDIRSARGSWRGVTTSQPAVLTHAKAGH